MPIVLTRIDDRLIHGQVTEGWCKKIKTEAILVVSDEISSSGWLCDICFSALSKSCNGLHASVKDAPRIINELDKDARSSYVLFESPRDACTVIKNGAHISSINVGGMHSRKGKREILDYVFVDDEDVKHLKCIRDMGVKLNFRDLPDKEIVDVMSRL